MKNLRNHQKIYLTATVPRRKRTKTRKKPKMIPTDVLMEIFKRLPSKDLMQFRCVSKSWNLVIRDPIFAQLHQTISQTRPSATTSILMGCIRPGRKIYVYKINYQRTAVHELTIDTEFLDSINTYVTEIVNGLVCLCRFGNVMVVNITTREIVSLPPQPPNSLDLYPVYSLGYDPLNQEYKVLCIWYRSGYSKCTVFTIGKSTEWREVINPLPSELVPKGFRSVLYRDVVYNAGALHWLTQTHWSTHTYLETKQKLVSFDVREEKFMVIDVPEIRLSGIGPILVRLEGHLYVFAGSSNLFILEDYKNPVWVEKNIRVPSMICPIGCISNRLICRQSSGRTFEFDPSNGKVMDFVISGEGKDVVEKSIGSLLYPAKYSICETVENIYPLRQN